MASLFLVENYNAIRSIITQFDLKAAFHILCFKI